MPTVLDELIVQTKVDLSGLQAGLRQAEQETAAAAQHAANESAPIKRPSVLFLRGLINAICRISTPLNTR